MTASYADVLSDLKNYSSCNDDLAITVRKTVLEPFQVDLSRPESIKPSPSPQAFKQMAVRLAPLAMRIVNQNSETFTKLKKENLSKDLYTVAVNCLIDSSFYALTALRHMNTLTTLKPLDIEKTTSNIISKIVDLGEVIMKKKFYYFTTIFLIQSFRSMAELYMNLQNFVSC
jgi:hypothetical protein